MDYKAGDFFGERALLKSEPRAANVVATSDCIMVSMDRHSVKRLLGPLEDLLKRNFEIYEKYPLPSQWVNIEDSTSKAIAVKQKVWDWEIKSEIMPFLMLK